MAYREVIQLFERRRAQLILILKEKQESIDLSRQHQIYGAIKEIELFLETLGYYQESYFREQGEVQNLLEETDKRPFIHKLRDSLKDKIIK